MTTRCPDHQIIARRALHIAGATWRPAPGAPLSIAAARDAYDRGEIELATGRDGDYATLYAIPRRERDIRTAWFGRPGVNS